MSEVSYDPSLERSFRGHRAAVNSISFAPNMKMISSASDDGVVYVWHFKPNLRALKFIGHKGPVNSVCFAPQGNLLASASSDNTIRLWEPTVMGKSQVLHGHAGPVRSVDFSSDGKLLLTASNDKSAKIWNVLGHRFVCSFVTDGHSNWIRSAKFSPDIRLAVTGSEDKTVKLWDTNSHSMIHTYYDHLDAINTVAFHPHGSLVAAGSNDNSIKLWDVRTKTLIQHYAAADGAVRSIAFHPSGDWLVSGADDSQLKIWDLREGVNAFTVHGHKGPALATSFSPAGDFFASSGADCRVMVFRTNFDQMPSVAAPVKPKAKDNPIAAAAGPRPTTAVTDDSKRALSYEQSSPQRASKAAVRPATAGAAALGPMDPPFHPDVGYPYDCNYQHSHHHPTVGGVTHSYVPPSGGESKEHHHPHAEAPVAVSRIARPATAGPSLSQSTGPVSRLPRSEQASMAGSTRVQSKQHVSATTRVTGVSSSSSGTIGGLGTGSGEAFQAVPVSDHVRRLPEELSTTLSHIVGQLDMMAKSMAALEMRMRLQETNVARIQNALMITQHDSALADERNRVGVDRPATAI